MWQVPLEVAYREPLVCGYRKYVRVTKDCIIVYVSSPMFVPVNLLLSSSRRACVAVIVNSDSGFCKTAVKFLIQQCNQLGVWNDLCSRITVIVSIFKHYAVFNFVSKVQSNPVNTDTEGAIESVRLTGCPDPY